MDMVWEKIKGSLRRHISESNYHMWIEPIECLAVQNGGIVLACPNFFSKKKVQGQFGTLIEEEGRKVVEGPFHIILEVTKRSSEQATEAVRSASLPPEATNAALPLTPTGDSSEKPRQMLLPDFGLQPHVGRLLQKDFTFDTFVVGSNNDFAYSAAMELASERNSTQNSLLLMADTGLGKTHLSQAMGRHILTQAPGRRVFYITAEDFTNEMCGCFKLKKYDDFHAKYRKQCDVLLLEDIHFLSGKERTQNELALVLDHLMESRKKIIFTSSYAPGDIPKMSGPLTSRISGSIVTKMEPPDYRTRVRILRRKARMHECRYVPDDVIEYLAGELTENIRQLESGLNGVAMRSHLMNIPVDMALAEGVVKLIVNHKRAITIDNIKKLVSRHYNINISDLVSQSRKKQVVRPRQIAIYLSRRYTDQPLQAIGRSFNRYHATAIHAIAAIEREIKTDPRSRRQVEFLCGEVENARF